MADKQKKTITSRVYNIEQFEINPKTGEDLHFSEKNILNCIKHRTIKKWAYILHDKDITTEQDKEKYGIEVGVLKKDIGTL